MKLNTDNDTEKEQKIEELEELVDLKNRMIQVLIAAGKITNEDAKLAREIVENF